MMDILFWLAIFGIAYMLMVIITFGCILSDVGIDDSADFLFFIFLIFVVTFAIVLSMFWPYYWYEEYKDRKGNKE